MYKFLTKNGQTLAFLVGLAVTAIFLIGAFSGMDEFNMMDEKLRNTSDIFNFGIKAAVAMVIICGIGMIVAILLNVGLNIKGNIKLIIGLVVIAAVYFIFGGASATPEAADSTIGALLLENKISEGANKFISGGIWTALVLCIVAFASFILLEILNFFK